MEPTRPTYTTDGDAPNFDFDGFPDKPEPGDLSFYVKATSNCEPLGLTTLQALFGGTWSTWRWLGDAALIKTGPDLTPRLVVGWTDLYGGTAIRIMVYERIGDHDEPAWAIVGGNSGLRIMANDDELDDFEPAPGAEHLPPGWGAPVLLIEDAGDIVDEALRKALKLDTDQPYSEPPDWSASTDDQPYFGACPVCHSPGVCVSRPEHWFVCTEHRLRWSGGYNILSGPPEALPAEYAGWQVVRPADRPTYTQLLNRLKDIMLAMELQDLAHDDDVVRNTLRSVRKDMVHMPPYVETVEIEREAFKVIADPEYWPTWTATADAGDDLPPELDFDDLAKIASAWPWAVKDALGRYVATALTDAGIPRTQRLAVIERLAVLGGEIEG